MTALYYPIPKFWKQTRENQKIMKARIAGRLKNAAWLENPPRDFWGWWVILGDGVPLAKGRTRTAAVNRYHTSGLKAFALQIAPIGRDGRLMGLYDR